MVIAYLRPLSLKAPRAWVTNSGRNLCVRRSEACVCCTDHSRYRLRQDLIGTENGPLRNGRDRASDTAGMWSDRLAAWMSDHGRAHFNEHRSSPLECARDRGMQLLKRPRFLRATAIGLGQTLKIGILQSNGIGL